MYKVLFCDDVAEDINSLTENLRRVQDEDNVVDERRLLIEPQNVMTEDALRAKVAEFNPDVIIMDLYDQSAEFEAPKWVGAKLIDILKNGPERLIPIIIWTQEEREPYREAVRGFRNGARDIVFKPGSEEYGSSSKAKYKELYVRIMAALSELENERAEREQASKEESRKKSKRLYATISASVLIAVSNMIFSFFSYNGSWNWLAIGMAILSAILAWSAYFISALDNALRSNSG